MMTHPSEQTALMTRKWFVCLVASLCCLLWGSAFPCIKIGYRLYEIASTDIAGQILFAGVRFFLAGIFTLLWAGTAQRQKLLPKTSSWKPLILLALSQTALQYLLFYASLAHTTGVRGSIIISSNAFFSILIAALLFRLEKLSRLKGLGCLLGFGGVVLINMTPDMFNGGITMAGEGFMLLAALCSAMGSVLFKRYAGMESASILSGYQFLLGGGALMAAGFLLGGRLVGGGSAALLMLYMAVMSAVSQTLWAMLLHWNPVSRVTVYQFLTPVCGVLLSILLVNESSQVPAVQCLAALALVSAGIWVINRPAR